MIYLSSNPITLAVAAELGSRNFAPAADFSREGECGNDECTFEGEMEFHATGLETAEAECPRCGDTVEIYTAD